MIKFIILEDNGGKENGRYKKEQERDELDRAIWAIADELRGAVDGWDFKNYVLGTMFYRYISENLCNYINSGEIEAGNTDFDYAKMSDEEAREGLVEEKGFFTTAQERIQLVTQYILEYFDQKTYRGDKTYIYNRLMNVKEVASAKRDDEVEEIKEKQRISGFNSIFAVSSVPMAKLYYQEFKKANEEESDGILYEENSEDTSAFDQSSRDFLEQAIDDYNKTFQTNYDTSSDKFQNYYKDVSLHMKNKEVLITINKAIDASPELRSKKQLIENFISGINDVMDEWHSYVAKQRKQELDTIITEERLKPEDTRKFIENAFRDGEIKTVGTDIDKLMPPISRFGGGGRTKCY